MRTSLLLALCLAAAGCAGEPPERVEGGAAADPAADADQILAVLNGETRAALGRDYDGWRDHWVHEPYAVKTYTDAAGGAASVTLGWDAVDGFVRTYLEGHPEPEPPPPPLEAADVHVDGDAAWVVYEQDDADQGRKREARRLERVDGAWRIAAMHTTVLGPE